VPQSTLSAAVLAALKERNRFDTAEVDDVIWGVSAAIGLQVGDIGRMAALDAGYDVKAGGVTLNRFCGSSLAATSFASAKILSGMSGLMIAGDPEASGAAATWPCDPAGRRRLGVADAAGAAGAAGDRRNRGSSHRRGWSADQFADQSGSGQIAAGCCRWRGCADRGSSASRTHRPFFIPLRSYVQKLPIDKHRRFHRAACR
jgi:acetyl-CoA C-acetyltransferase